MSNWFIKALLFFGCPIVLIGGGLFLADYSTRPESSGNVLEHLKEVATTADDMKQEGLSPSDSVLFFYHPHCPCTMSAVRNLSKIVMTFSSSPTIAAYAFCPDDKPDQWITSRITTELQKIHQVEIVVDRNANVTRRFGVATSGHVLHYGPDGTLLFSGAITPSRGHEGDCAASNALTEAVNRNPDSRIHWPVYGCPLISN